MLYDGIQSEVVSTTRFDENSDLSGMYLGRSDRAKCDKLKAEESFLHIRTGIYIRQVVRWNMECQLLLDTGTNKSYHVKILLYTL